MTGWIKLQRDIMDHWIAQDNEYLAVWVRMLAEANFNDRKTVINGALVEVKRGQLVFGLDSYSEKTGVSVRRLRKLLELLENDGMIDRQKSNKFSLISIVNYAKHQDDDRQKTGESQADDKQTSGEGQAKGSTIRSKELKEGKELKKNNSDLDFSSWPHLPSPQIFNDWVQVRKAKKAAITQTAIERIGKQLHKAVSAGWSVDDALSQAVASGWTGFDATWLKGSPNGAPERINQIANAHQEFLNGR